MDERQLARQRLEEKLRSGGVRVDNTTNPSVSTNSPQEEARQRLTAKLKSGNVNPTERYSSQPTDQTQPATTTITPAQPSWWESAGSWISDTAKSTWKTITDPIEKRQKENEAELKLMQEREKRGIKTPSISEPSSQLNLSPDTRQMVALPIQEQPMYVVNKVNKEFLESVKQNREELLSSGKYMNYAPNAQITDNERRRSESSYEIYNDIKELDEALKTGNYFTTALKFRAAEVKGNFQVAASSFVRDLANSTLSIYDQVALTDEQKKDMQRYGSAVNNEFVKFLDDVITENTYNDPDLGDALQQGVGSMITIAVTSLATGGGVWIPTIIESFQQAGSTYDDNIKQGKSAGDAFTRSSAVFVGNMIWNRLLNKFSGVFDVVDQKVLSQAKKDFFGTLFNVGGRAGTGEFVQESGQQIMSNFAADRPWDEGVVESGIVGFAIGGGAKSLQFINLKNNEPFLEITDLAVIEKALEQFDTNALQTLNQYSQTKVSPESSVSDIRKAFKEAAFLTNPDINGGDPEIYRRVVRAYNDLIKIREAGVEITDRGIIIKPDGTEVVTVAQEPVTEEVAQPTPQEAKITPPPVEPMPQPEPEPTPTPTVTAQDIPTVIPQEELERGSQILFKKPYQTLTPTQKIKAAQEARSLSKNQLVVPFDPKINEQYNKDPVEIITKDPTAQMLLKLGTEKSKEVGNFTDGFIYVYNKNISDEIYKTLLANYRKEIEKDIRRSVKKDETVSEAEIQQEVDKALQNDIDFVNKDLKKEYPSGESFLLKVDESFKPLTEVGYDFGENAKDQAGIILRNEDTVKVGGAKYHGFLTARGLRPYFSDKSERKFIYYLDKDKNIAAVIVSFKDTDNKYKIKPLGKVIETKAPEPKEEKKKLGAKKKAPEPKKEVTDVEYNDADFRKESQKFDDEQEFINTVFGVEKPINPIVDGEKITIRRAREIWQEENTERIQKKKLEEARDTRYARSRITEENEKLVRRKGWLAPDPIPTLRGSVIHLPAYDPNKKGDAWDKKLKNMFLDTIIEETQNEIDQLPDTSMKITQLESRITQMKRLKTVKMTPADWDNVHYLLFGDFESVKLTYEQTNEIKEEQKKLTPEAIKEIKRKQKEDMKILMGQITNLDEEDKQKETKPAEPKKKEQKKDARTKYLEEQARKKFTSKTKPEVLRNETIGAVNGIANQLQSQDENLLKDYPELKSSNIIVRINAALKAVEDFGMNEVLDEDYINLKRIKIVVETRTKEEPKGLTSKIGKGYFDLTDKLTLGMRKPKAPKKAKANLDDFIIDDEDVEIEEDPLKKLYDSYEQAEKDLANALGESEKYTNIIQMPELVQIAEQLSNNPVEIKDKLNKRGSFRGVFRSRGKDGRILLRTDLFKYPFLAQKVLSHEIGHLVDWLPDFNLSRGNILGRIGSLKSFMRDTFTNFETEKKVEKLLEDLRSVQEQRRSLKVGKVVPEQNKQKDLELNRRVREINKQITELQKDGIKSDVITKELRNWSYYWRNINPTEVEILDPQFLKYIHTPEELYADAISGIFSSPLKFREFAPNFVKAFYANIDAKPQVKALYDSIQDAINSGDLSAMRNQNIDNAYKKGEDIRYARELEKQSMEKNLWFQIRTLFVRQQTAVLDFEDDKNIPVDSRASIVLGDLAYSDGFVKNMIEDAFVPSYDLANSIENGWNDLGKLLFYERVIYERGELANPDGFNPEIAREEYDKLLANKSEEDRNKLLQALRSFRDGQEQVLQYIKESGIYSDTLIEQMEANPAYATFQVIDYIQENISSEIYKQEGTLSDIENPATATLMKNVSIIQSILRNNANKSIGEQMIEFDPQNAKPAEIVYDPTLKRQIVKEPKNKNLGLIKWRDGGSWKGVYVDKYISEVNAKLPTQTMQMLANVSNKLLIAPLYRNLFIVWNLQFQSFNLIRDFLRLWKAVPTSNFWSAMKQFGDVAKSYKGSIKSAWARATDNYDAVVREMEDKMILGLTYSDVISAQSEEEAQVTRSLRKLGIRRGETRTGIDKTIYELTKNQKELAKAYDIILDLLRLPNTISDFFESLPKIAGYKMLKGTMPEGELREFVRTRIGSPAYRYKGSATPFTNNLFLFSNAIIQSTVADIKTATEPTTRSGYWYKTMVANVLPQVIKKAALAGLLGELMKEIYEKISSFDLANYGIIPLGLDENLKAIYMRIPSDPSGQIINAITWKLLNAPDDGLGVDDIKEIILTLDQVTFNFNPSIEILQNITDYASGRNPYDSFRGRPMIPDKEWKARNETNDAFNIFLTEIGKKMGFGIILPSNNDWQPESTLTDLQKFLSKPIINKSIGAFIKVSDYGEVERNRKERQNIEGRRAAQNLKDDKSVEKAINDYFSQEDRSAKAKDKFFKQALTDSFGKTSATTEDEVKRVKSMETKFKTSLLRGKADTKINAFIDANTNEEKAYLLLKYKGEMSKEEFTEFGKNLEKYDLITQDVVDKAKEIQSGR